MPNHSYGKASHYVGLDVLLFTEEIQMEPIDPYVVCYHTSQEEVLDQIEIELGARGSI